MRDWYRRQQIASQIEHSHAARAPFFQGSLVSPSQAGVPGTAAKIEAGAPADAWSALQAAQGAQAQHTASGHMANPSSFKSLPRGVVPSRGPRTRFYDPLALMYATGYRDRRFSVSYNTLRLLTYQLSSVGAIINTRVKQIAAFAQPFRQNKQVGFEIRWKDQKRIPTEEDEKAIERVESFVSNCGWGDNPHSYQKRPRLREFLGMFIRDSLTFDQACAVAGTWVELADGTGIEIENIRSGMEVRSHTGNVRKVIHPTSRTYTGEMCCIQVRGQELNVTAGHPLLVAKRTSHKGNTVVLAEPEWVAASEVTSEDYVVYPRFPMGEIKDADTSDSKYFYMQVSKVSKSSTVELPVFNMEVEEDHSYLANGFVSHNCFEIVPDTEGRPFEFFAVDSSSIRLAATFDGHRGPGPQKLKANQFTEKWKKMFQKELELDPEEERIHTVQLIHGRIENVYGFYDLAFCTRNKRSDLWVNGYGFSEAEMCINMMLGMLWGEEYNRRFFKQGAAPKGILNIKGEGISPEEMEGFRRQWYAMISGVENAWRTPVLQADGMEYQSLQNTNTEMQFQEWLNYQMRIVCAVYGIDPLEINQEMAASGASQGPMFESQHEWKLKNSRDKGLRPLLKFVQEALQTHLIDPLDSRMMIEFVGLDEMTEQDKLDMIVLKTTNIMTINEGRSELGLQPLAYGDYINSPQAIQVIQGMQAEGADPFASNEELETPYDTAGDLVQPSYGEGPAVPLYIQRRALRVDEWSESSDRNTGGGGGEGGPPPPGDSPGEDAPPEPPSK